MHFTVYLYEGAKSLAETDCKTYQTDTSSSHCQRKLSGRFKKTFQRQTDGKEEAALGEKVFLELRIKVDKDWRNDERKLKQYGYFDG